MSSSFQRKQPFFGVVSMPVILSLLVMTIATAQMAQTIFVPALPLIGQGLQASNGYLQAIMAIYLTSYGLMQFVYGPLSDRIGRKKPLIFGMCLFIVGALIAGVSQSINMLLFASFLQGCGTASAGALSRSIPRDYYFGDRLKQFNSYISMAVIFSPLIAPFFGGWLAQTWGWHAVYFGLALFGLIVVITLAYGFTESLPVNQRNSQPAIAAYKAVLSNRHFKGYMFALLATFAGVAGFEAIAGILYGQSLQMSPFVVSCYFVAPIPGYLLGAFIASKQQSMNKLLYQGIALLGAGALFLLVPGLFGLVFAWCLLAGSVLFFTGAGILYPTLTSAALEPFPRHAGVAGALLGGLQNFGAGIAATAMALIPMDGQLSIGLLSSVMVIIVIVAIQYAKDSHDHDIATHGAAH